MASLQASSGDAAANEADTYGYKKCYKHGYQCSVCLQTFMATQEMMAIQHAKEKHPKIPFEECFMPESCADALAAVRLSDAVDAVRQVSMRQDAGIISSNTPAVATESDVIIGGDLIASGWKPACGGGGVCEVGLIGDAAGGGGAVVASAGA